MSRRAVIAIVVAMTAFSMGVEAALILLMWERHAPVSVVVFASIAIGFINGITLGVIAGREKRQS